MTAEEIYKVVKILTGKIEPQGETNCDEIRLKNQKVTQELISMLLDDIELLERHSKMHEYSIKTSGELAKRFRDGLQMV
jgi:hypothetical protein